MASKTKRPCERTGPKKVEVELLSWRAAGDVPTRPVGRFDRGGTVTVTWNVQVAKLRAPDAIAPDGSRIERHYLPCDYCGALMAVRMNVVSTACPPCYLVSTGGYPVPTSTSPRAE